MLAYRMTWMVKEGRMQEAIEMHCAIPDASPWVVPGQGHDPFRKILPVFAPMIILFFRDD